MYIGNITLLIPAIYLCAAAVIVLLAGVVASKRPDKGIDHWFPVQYLAPVLTAVGTILSGGLVYWSFLAASKPPVNASIGGEVTSVSRIALFVTAGGHAQLTMDPFAALLGLIAVAGTLIVMFLSLDHFGEHQIHKAEYYSLLMFAAAAASFAAASSDLIAIYLSIEFLSLTSYVLAAFAKTDRRSAEAGLKYFLYGAACSAIMIYGMSILFGVTGGNTSLAGIAAGLAGASQQTGIPVASTGIVWVGIMLTLAGLGFKLALVPFQFWAPDTYEGAPTPITAFLSVVSKAAGLAVVIRFLVTAGIPAAGGVLSWYWILVALTAVSMFYGNLVAIPQRNIKRMLAYSSIAQVGYLMVGVLTAVRSFAGAQTPLFGTPGAAVRAEVTGAAPWDMQGVLIYIAAYLLMNLGAFAVVTAIGWRTRSDSIDEYGGMMRRSPLFACALAVFLVSLAGVPPTAGFLGKFFIFGGAISVGLKGAPELAVLAIVGVINSVISAFYYLNVVRAMFFESGEGKKEVRGSFAMNAVVVVTLVATLGMIVLAKPVSRLASDAVYTTAPNRVTMTNNNR